MSVSLWLVGVFNVILGLICPAAKVFLLCAWQRDLWQQLIILNSKPQLFYSKNIFSDKKTLTWSKNIKLDIVCSVLRWFEKSWSCCWSKKKFIVVLSDEKNQQISLLKTALLGLKQREGEEVSPRTKRGPDKLYAQTFLDDKFALFAKQIRRTWPRRRGFDRDKLINNDEGTLHKQVLDMGRKKSG